MSSHKKIFEEALQKSLPRRSFLQVLGLGSLTLAFGKLLSACAVSDAPEELPIDANAACTGDQGSLLGTDCWEYTQDVTVGSETRTFKIKIWQPHGHKLELPDEASLSSATNDIEGLSETHSHNVDLSGSNSILTLAQNASISLVADFVTGHDHAITITRTA